MKLFKVYLILLSACWGFHLQFKLITYAVPLITPANQVKLGVKIPNLWSALVQANVYTLPALWATRSRGRAVRRGKLLVRYNFNWVFMMPYLMHCVQSIWNNVRYMLATFATASVLQSSNIIGVFVKLLMIITLHMFSLLEIGMIMNNWMRRLCRNGERIY